MNNNCFTEFTFASRNPEAAKEFKDFVVDAFYKPESLQSMYGKDWLGNILLKAGIKPETYRCKGSCIKINELASVCGAEKYTKFSVITETSWEPCVAMWKPLIKMFPDVEMSFVSESPDEYLKMSSSLVSTDNVDYLLDGYFENDKGRKTILEYVKSEELEKRLKQVYSDIIGEEINDSTETIITILREKADKDGCFFTVKKFKNVKIDEF